MNERGAVLDIDARDIVTIDTSMGLLPGIPRESQLKVLEIISFDTNFKEIVFENLTPENHLPSSFVAILSRGRRLKDGPWLDVISMTVNIFPYDFEVMRVEKPLCRQSS